MKLSALGALSDVIHMSDVIFMLCPLAYIYTLTKTYPIPCGDHTMKWSYKKASIYVICETAHALYLLMHNTQNA